MDTAIRMSHCMQLICLLFQDFNKECGVKVIVEDRGNGSILNIGVVRMVIKF